MTVDVIAEILINKPRAQVSDYAMDPHNDPSWISGINQVSILTDPPLAEGSRVQRIAAFMGRRIEYIMHIDRLQDHALLEMHSIKGPFPMKVTYAFEDDSNGTIARIRVEGDAGGFYRLASPMISRAVQSNITQDLDRLKQLLEDPPTEA